MKKEPQHHNHSYCLAAWNNNAPWCMARSAVIRATEDLEPGGDDKLSLSFGGELRHNRSHDFKRCNL